MLGKAALQKHGGVWVDANGYANFIGISRFPTITELRTTTNHMSRLSYYPPMPRPDNISSALLYFSSTPRPRENGATSLRHPILAALCGTV